MNSVFEKHPKANLLKSNALSDTSDYNIESVLFSTHDIGTLPKTQTAGSFGKKFNPVYQQLNIQNEPNYEQMYKQQKAKYMDAKVSKLGQVGGGADYEKLYRQEKAKYVASKSQSGGADYEKLYKQEKAKYMDAKVSKLGQVGGGADYEKLYRQEKAKYVASKSQIGGADYEQMYKQQKAKYMDAKVSKLGQVGGGADYEKLYRQEKAKYVASKQSQIGG